MPFSSSNAPYPANEPLPSGNAFSVLVVEDQGSVRAALVAELRRSGVSDIFEAPEGQAALDKGIEIATRRNERLLIVNAGPGGGQDEAIVNGYEVERVEERLAKLPVQAEFKQFVRGNSTIDEIIGLVESQQVSVLVIGLRKRTAVGKLLLGSMAQEILMTVDCPVLCVKAA